MSNRHFVISSFIEGEGFSVATPITENDLKKIEKITGHDFMDDLNLEQPVRLMEVTAETTVEQQLNGAIMDGCYTKPEQIMYVIGNGLEDWELEIIKNKYPKELELAQMFDDSDKLEYHLEKIGWKND